MFWLLLFKQIACHGDNHRIFRCVDLWRSLEPDHLEIKVLKNVTKVWKEMKLNESINSPSLEEKPLSTSNCFYWDRQCLVRAFSVLYVKFGN